MNKRLVTFLQQIAKEVEDKAIKTILGRGTSFYYEKVVGATIITIDFQEYFVGGWKYAEYDVCVGHEDGHKRSPLLENAIKAVMPDWFQLKEQNEC